MGPKETLRSFVNYRFSEGQSRDKLLEMTTGDLNRSIGEMSDSAFERFTQMKLKKKSFKIINSRCEGPSCSITYFIKYQSLEDPASLFTTSAKKIVRLNNEEGVWKISEVKNIKSFHDNEKAIEVIGN